MADKNHSHDGHRDRMRNRFLKGGFENFEAHEILEMLLYYSIPRKNTNEIAHELINTFGSLYGVFDADIEALLQVKGISYNSAVLIKMIPQICSIYSNQKDKNNVIDVSNWENLKQYAINQYIGVNVELVKVMFLNSNLGCISCVDMHSIDNPNTVSFDAKKIVSYAEKYRSTHVILMHNHNNGNANPSKADVFSTKAIKEVLQKLGIIVVDHVIVAGKQVVSLFNSGYMSR